MNSITTVLTAEFEALKAEIAAAYGESAQEASGSWAQTLEVSVTGYSAAVLGAGYINGRLPGKPPPSKAIEQWLVDKGIAQQVSKSISIQSLAFLIARKIAKQGWKPRNGGTEALIARIATPQRIQQIIDRAGGELLPHFTQQILDYLKPPDDSI